MDRRNNRSNGAEWKAYLEAGVSAGRTIDTLRTATRTGRPLGSEDWILGLEATTGRKLLRHKPGPKPRRRPPEPD